MSRLANRLLVAFIMGLGLSGTMTLHLWAQPFATSMATAPGKAAEPLVKQVHGFHCRMEYGWDPRAGVYHRHSHKGICQDYKRCLQVHHRCILILGRGWDSWKYERWGWDNWRYTSCMVDNGCS